MANLNELQERAEIQEFTIQKDPRDIAEIIVKQKPKILGLSVYIWNAQESLTLVSLIKKVAPEIVIVLGGPEVSHESEGQSICQIADFTIKGEADFLFYEFCRDFLMEGKLPDKKILSGMLPDIKQIKMPYDLYTDEDIKNRVIYVEVSRGCPYRCEYCLSSLDKSVRNFDLSDFLAHMQSLLDRGARQFKFIDRTFNLTPLTCITILQFFYSQIHLGLFLHFEMVPDRLPLEIRDLVKKFPPGSLQFEIGIQTWNPEVAKLVSRRNDYTKVKDNFHFLANETGVHTHADLIAGLPGEDIHSFAEGFDTLSALRPNEIQVGILKRLKGAPIARHDLEWEMVYSDQPPFQILRTKSMDFETLQIMNRFAKYWDLYANSGVFKKFVDILRAQAEKEEDKSFFWEFYRFNDFLSQRYAQSYGISQTSLFESAYIYLIDYLDHSEESAQEIILEDYRATGKSELPKFFNRSQVPKAPRQPRPHIPKRQQRHLAGANSQ